METNESDNNNNNNNTGAKDENFASELSDLTDKNKAEVENYSNQQEKYRQMMPTYESSEDPYIWRIGFGRRVAAYIIDSILLFLLLLLASYFFGTFSELKFLLSSGVNYQSVEFINDFMLLVENLLPLSISVSAVYYFTEIFFAATPGKMLLGIVIGTEDKKFAPISKLLLRFAIKNSSLIFNFLFLITSLSVFSSISSIVSFVVFLGCFAVFTIKKQALHDIISKSAVYFKDELKQFDNNSSSN